MTEEIPSARPTFPQPTPAEDIPADAPALEPATPPQGGPGFFVGTAAEVAPPETVDPAAAFGTPIRLPDSVAEARVALDKAESVLVAHHQNPEFVAATAAHERLASALTLVQQARDRFEEWIAATF